MAFKRTGTISGCGILLESFINKTRTICYFPDSVHRDSFESRVSKEAVAVGILFPHDPDFIGTSISGIIKDLRGINEPAVVHVIAITIFLLTIRLSSRIPIKASNGANNELREIVISHREVTTLRLGTAVGFPFVDSVTGSP